MKYLKTSLPIIFYMYIYLFLNTIITYIIKVNNPLIPLIISSILTIAIYVSSYHGIVGKIKKVTKQEFAMAILTGFIVLSINMIIVTMVNYIFPNMIKEANEITKLLTNSNVFFSILCVVILSPVLEELLFRGIIYDELRTILPATPTILIQALLFALYHGNLYQGIYAFIIGIILGFITYKENNLTLTIIIHSINNALSMLIIYNNSTSIIILIFIISLLSIAYIKKNYLKKGSLKNSVGTLK